MMGLTLAERKAVTKASATRYQRAGKGGKGRILDELCANTGWHRNHARKALRPRWRPRSSNHAVPGLRSTDRMSLPRWRSAGRCWACRPVNGWRRCSASWWPCCVASRELVIRCETAALLVSMSAATIDRRLADERAKHKLKGRVGTKPGSLLKSQIPIRTWAEWDDAAPGFVEIDTVGHDGGNRGEAMPSR